MKDPGDVTLESNGDYWRAAWWDNGRRIRKGLGHKSKVSERAAQRMCRELGARNMASPGTRHMGRAPKLSAWAEEYATLREGEVSRTRARNDRRAIRYLIEFVGDKRVDQVTPAHIDDWRADLRSKDYTEHTMATYLSAASAMFNRLCKRGVIAANPARGLVVKPKASKGFVPPDNEVRSLLDSIRSPNLRGMVALCGLAGLRPGEARLMKWAAVRWDEGKLIVPQPKTEARRGETRECRLEPELAATLADIQLVTKADRITTVSVTYASRGIGDALEALGLERWKEPCRALRRWRATTWRRSFPEHVVDAWLGHSMEVARRHYAAVEDHYYTSEATNAANEVERLRGMLLAAGIDPDQSGPKVGPKSRVSVEAGES